MARLYVCVDQKEAGSMTCYIVLRVLFFEIETNVYHTSVCMLVPVFSVSELCVFKNNHTTTYTRLCTCMYTYKHDVYLSTNTCMQEPKHIMCIQVYIHTINTYMHAYHTCTYAQGDGVCRTALAGTHPSAVSV